MIILGLVEGVFEDEKVDAGTIGNGAVVAAAVEAEGDGSAVAQVVDVDGCGGIPPTARATLGEDRVGETGLLLRAG